MGRKMTFLCIFFAGSFFVFEKYRVQKTLEKQKGYFVETKPSTTEQQRKAVNLTFFAYVISPQRENQWEKNTEKCFPIN